MNRSLTVTWEDPLAAHAAGKLYAHGTTTCIILG
jgi:hypothetical protein